MPPSTRYKSFGERRRVQEEPDPVGIDIIGPHGEVLSWSSVTNQTASRNRIPGWTRPAPVWARSSGVMAHAVVTERLSAFVPAQTIMRRTIAVRSPDGKTAATMKKPNGRP